MDVKYINPFLHSTTNFFQSMLSTKVEFGKPSITQADDYRSDVSGAIGFSGEASGAVVLAFREDVAVAIASKFTNKELNVDHPDFADAIGEIANMVAGGAKTRIPNLKVDIALPSVIIGEQHQLAQSLDSPCLCIPCQSNLGDFVVHVAFELHAATPEGVPA